MSEDEAERYFEGVQRNPMAYAFEPVRRRERMENISSEEQPLVASGVERVGNTTWCLCGHCTQMPTATESICCREVDVDHLVRDIECITLSRTYQMLCCEREVLEISMLSLREVRANTLERPINSSLFRLTAYRQFTLWTRGHLGRRNRIPIPSCVVNSIRSRFPSPEYHGFEYFYDDI
uniref:P2X purinoreceptor 7 intracellular domain-containing protein n=1 Tax=Myripristis murdjan TaxID=586833 RepID=A0A667WXP1_9TELE